MHVYRIAVAHRQSAVTGRGDIIAEIVVVVREWYKVIFFF